MEAAKEAKLPRRVGRYDVVGMLATGGMAEILLGRVRGPRGFERPVVIKRILPHLARDQAFVHMFLDEAHIVGGVRHPNVVHVHELSQEDDDLFLVMEYLEGEPIASLQRRAASRGVVLDPGLCAYIVAEACAGLHAAHELTGPDGESRGIVHRDVSPQNIFVTYDGTVKVLDFGIAKAADRITRTEVGLVKGKFNYMSPEQCRGEPLDRRSDTFAAGIVLYELLTGRWLFRRATQAATIRAVLEHEIVQPSELVGDIPSELDGICMRALQRSRRRRYSTAAEMRRDLLVAVHTLSPGSLPEERLAALMGRMFADRVEEKNDMLRRVRLGEELLDVPPTVADAEVEIPIVQNSWGEGTGTEERAAHPSRGQGSRLITVAAAALALGALAGAWAMWRGASEDEPVAAATPPPATPAEPAENALRTVPDEAARAPDEPHLLEPEPGARAGEVTIRVESAPEGATVSVGGEARGSTPLDLRVARGTSPLSLQLSRDGYRPVSEEVVPDVDQRLRLSLPRETTRRRRTTRRRPRAPMMESGSGGFDLWN